MELRKWIRAHPANSRHSAPNLSPLQKDGKFFHLLTRDDAEHLPAPHRRGPASTAFGRAPPNPRPHIVVSVISTSLPSSVKHKAVSQLSVGRRRCPNLGRAAYGGASIEAAMENAARTYVNHPRGVRFDGRGRLTVSKI